jgi:hypothetical protein
MPKKANTKLSQNKVSLLIKQLRDAAAHNNRSYQFSSIETIDDNVCNNITGT